MRQRLMNEMHRKAGCRLDDAAACADVAMRVLREQRDALILAAHAAGLSARQIGRIVGLSHVRVLRVVTNGRGGLPQASGNVHPDKPASVRAHSSAINPGSAGPVHCVADERRAP